MKCKNCGHDYYGTHRVCPRCGQNFAIQANSPSQSKLLEFPRRQLMAEQHESIKPEVPAWRLELNEKLRAIKAKKESDSLNVTTTDGNSETKNLQPSTSNAATAFKTNLNSKPEIPKPKIVNPVVEKALRRARRANENAIRASIPRIDSARSSQAAAALALDKEATARKLEEDPLPHEKVYASPEIEVSLPPPEIIPQEALKPHPVVEQKLIYLEDDLNFDPYTGRPDPLDYIYAEVGKSEGAGKPTTGNLSRQMMPELKSQVAEGEIPGLSTHVKIALVDLVTIMLSSVPFLALIKYMGGNFNQSGTILVGIGLVGLITTFYLILTQSLCGKTFGMMVSRTHVVDALTDESPSIRCLTIRTLGYFVSFAAALAGFFWVAVDAQRRGWHDLISHTVVVRDR
jgi:uncharacterized RDD family membrane protein YckC